VIEMDAVLGLGLEDACLAETPPEPDLPAEAQSLADQRAEARASKNWAESDRLRDALHAMGYRVEDTKEGQKVTII
jgi:cysteinyl-tRNA synthetase